MLLPLLSVTDTLTVALPTLVGLKTPVRTQGDSPCAQDALVNENSEPPDWKIALTGALLEGVTVNDIGALIALTAVTGKFVVVGERTGAGESPNTLMGTENDCP